MKKSSEKKTLGGDFHFGDLDYLKTKNVVNSFEGKTNAGIGIRKISIFDKMALIHKKFFIFVKNQFSKLLKKNCDNFFKSF